MDNKSKKFLESCIDCSFCIKRISEDLNGEKTKFCCTLQNNKQIYSISNNGIEYKGKCITIDKNTEYPKCELGMWEKY